MIDNMLTDTDYTLHPDVDSVWITVGMVSVWVRRDADGAVTVQMFPRGEETGEPLDEARAFVCPV